MVWKIRYVFVCLGACMCACAKDLPTSLVPSVWDRTMAVQYMFNVLTLSQTSLVFTCLQYKAFENTVGKGEICSKRAISPFLTVFSTRLKNFLPFSSKLQLSSANSFIWKSNIFSLETV